MAQKKRSSTLEGSIQMDFPKYTAMRHYQRLGLLTAFLFLALVLGALIGDNGQERVGMAERVIGEAVEPSSISSGPPLTEERRNPVPKPNRSTEEGIAVGVAMTKIYCSYANYVCEYRSEEDCALATEACIDVRDSYLSSVTSPRRSTSVSGAAVLDASNGGECKNRAWITWDSKSWSQSNNPIDYCSCVEGPGCIYSCIDYWTNFIKECNNEYKILKESLAGSEMEAGYWEITNLYPYYSSERPSQEDAPQNRAGEFFYFGEVSNWVYPRIWPDAVGDPIYDQCNERRVTCNMYGYNAYGTEWYRRVDYSELGWVYANTRPLGVMSDGKNCEIGVERGYCIDGACTSCATPEDLSELDEESESRFRGAEIAVVAQRGADQCRTNLEATTPEEGMNAVEATLFILSMITLDYQTLEEIARRVSTRTERRENRIDEAVQCALTRIQQDLTLDQINQWGMEDKNPGDICVYTIQGKNGNRDSISGIVVNTANGLRCSPVGCPSGMTRAEGYGGRFLCCQGEPGIILVGSLGVTVDVPYCPASECDERTNRLCPHQSGSGNPEEGVCCPIDTDCDVERNKGFAICSERCGNPCTGSSFNRLNIVDLDFSDFKLCCDGEERCENGDGIPSCILNEERCREGRFECTSQQTGLSTCCKLGSEYCVAAGDNPACYPI